MNIDSNRKLIKKKRYEPPAVKIWKKQIIIYFFKVYQMKKESKLALMNSDDDYFNILKMELSKPVGKLKIKRNQLNQNPQKQIVDEITYFLNDIYNENDEIRSAPVK